MSLSPTDIARIDSELRAERQKRLKAWDARAPELDIGSQASRERWTTEREKFFDEIGPVPPDAPSRAKLRGFKDRHQGKRIFIIGNGPSLNHTALHLLEGEFTFGVNRIYLMFDRISWRPTFYTTLDWRVAPDCAPEINRLRDMELFFPERFRGLLRDGEDVTWYSNDRARHKDQQGFATDASLGVRGAGSVTGAAIQLAFHMGFDPIYLIGCDVSYSVAETVIQEGPDKFNTGVGLYLTSTKDDDENHFDKRYFGAGMRWHDPNVKRMMEGFGQCRDGANRQGRTIRNATEGGQLEVFERSPFRSLFPRGDRPAPTPSLAGFIVAALSGKKEGLMVDIGAGSGSHLAAFGAMGWEVRALEPSSDHRDLLRRSLPMAWNVFIDPRALDTKTGSIDTYPAARIDGINLTPLSATSEPGRQIEAATPEFAMEPIGGRAPDVLAIDVNGWELRVLNAWPFESAKPQWMVVVGNDGRDLRPAFGRQTACDALRSRGYGVLAIDNGRAFAPDEDWLTTTHRGAFTVVGTPDGFHPAANLLDAVVDAYSVAVSLGTEASVHPGSEESDGADAAHARGLEEELTQIRNSTSWRLGSGIVQTGSRVIKGVKSARAQASNLVRRRKR